MGKSKQRIIRKGKNDQFASMSREDAVCAVVQMLETDIRAVHNLVTLFGLSAEELLEAGASYEAVSGLEGICA